MKDIATASYLQIIISTVIYDFYYHACFVNLPLFNTILLVSQYPVFNLKIQLIVEMVEGCVVNYKEKSKNIRLYLTFLSYFCLPFTGLFYNYAENFFIAYVIIFLKYLCLLPSIFLGSFSVIFIFHVVPFTFMKQNGVI